MLATASSPLFLAESSAQDFKPDIAYENNRFVHGIALQKGRAQTGILKLSAALSWEPFVDERWVREENYHNSFLLKGVENDEAIDFCTKNSEKNGLPAISIGPNEGRYLQLQAKAIGAKRILELGTLGGHSAIWLARALPEDGELITCELKPKHAEVAKQNIEHAGLSSKVKVLVGPAAESIAKLDPAQKFDMVFMDCQFGYVDYLESCKTLLRKGGLIIIDNMVFGGYVSDTAVTDYDFINECRKALEFLGNNTEFYEATTMQRVGARSWDGFTFIVRK
ncbi:S-adenosyl-L-methionine-dependent methyltransferase [Heliocybe sulcata]|uniref:S-adenosyl-L-methionine-dependent methyltransferase n=1 Tax=Heliocybe sulcata TaxID=5364 RepID=A0A5C3NA78_9AGAM|nr:S-adenosyl-L-methionine-dependent methyltransferase [Heliocybe sulcata]